ncbi:MAG: hypothetical protein DRP68_00280 [Candidatus Omnitrophota bacterium]|nr:MAG: hypothetical protein DRP68_00280 [Candidatus Omnitrophota bacterium]RKY46560.1 MAG: hypothetical protein DRP81_00245 [Candidatus Omnitrophota bacterium]HDN86501.1 hypothetical protein [Candidatus Omnitrophota bacterium]
MRQIVLFTLVVFLYGCVTIYNPATQRREFYFIDENTEILLGKNLASQILNSKKLVKDKNLNRYLQEIGERIAKVCDRSSLNYHFYILDEEEINAFALPGGYVFVNRGLIDRVGRDELAFCLGHEVGHICARHALKRLQASLGMQLILSLALKNPEYINIRKGLEVIYNVISLGYSRQDEFLADYLGVKYAYKAGFSPQGAVILLEKLKREGEVRPFVFLSSHPPPQARIERIKEEIKKLEENG